MNYRIEKKDAIRVVGISIPMYKEVERNFEVIPPLWTKCAMDGTIMRLAPLINSEPMGLLGVCLCNDETEWRYYIAVSTSAEAGDLEEYTIPAATWAIFSGEGTGQSIQDLEKRIVTEWLPSSGYEYGNAADIEVYFNDDPSNTKYEVWIPVVKKA